MFTDSSRPCPLNGYHRCIENNYCIRPEYVCDKDDDCGDGSDEVNCGKCYVHMNDISKCFLYYYIIICSYIHYNLKLVGIKLYVNFMFLQDQ